MRANVGLGSGWLDARVGVKKTDTHREAMRVTENSYLLLSQIESPAPIAFGSYLFDFDFQFEDASGLGSVAAGERRHAARKVRRHNLSFGSREFYSLSLVERRPASRLSPPSFRAESWLCVGEYARVMSRPLCHYVASSFCYFPLLYKKKATIDLKQSNKETFNLMSTVNKIGG